MTATIEKPTTEKPKLTKRQIRVYRYILRHYAEQGIPPTVRDICREFGYASTNAVVCHLFTLQRKGRIRLNGKIARGIVVVGLDDAIRSAVQNWIKEREADSLSAF